MKVLIVLYKKSIRSSETCISLMNLDSSVINSITDLYVWNNSPTLLPCDEKYEFNSYFRNVKIKYYEDGSNHPLSKVYNTIISEIDENDGLLILDHDSVFDSSLFEELTTVLVKYSNINLFLPRIYYKSTMVSPARQYYFYGRYFKKEKLGFVTTRFLTAINSGMFIRCRYLKEKFEGYNEEIKFYGTDNDFMYKYSRQNEYAYILEARLEHTLNYYEDASLESRLRRFHDMKNGMLVQMKNINIVLLFLSHIYLFLYACKMNFKYRTFLFFE